MVVSNGLRNFVLIWQKRRALEGSVLFQSLLVYCRSVLSLTTQKLKGTARLPFLQILAGCTLGVPRSPALLTDWLQISGSHNPIRSNNMLEQLTELRKVLYLK